jgi:hypothetical protein
VSAEYVRHHYGDRLLRAEVERFHRDTQSAWRAAIDREMRAESAEARVEALWLDVDVDVTRRCSARRWVVSALA